MWSISLNIRVAEHPTDWLNIFLVTANILHDPSAYGNVSPLLQIKPDTKTFYFRAAVNGDKSYHFHSSPYKLNQTQHMEIHQRYVSDGNYRFYALLDGAEMHTVLNTDARQFYNVHVYATNNRFTKAPIVYISDFRHTNFM